MRKILKKFTALMLTASLAAAPALQVMAAPEKDAPPDFIKNLNISDNPFEFYFSLENKNEYLDAMTLDEIKGFSNVLKYISLEYASSNHKILEDDISKTYSDFKKKFLNEKFEDSKSGFEMISEHAAKLNVQDFDTYKKYLTETSDLKITECLNVMTEIDQSETSEQVDENSMKLTALLKEKKDAAMNEELSDEKNQNEVQENNIKNENNKPQSEEIKNHSIEDNKEESSKKQKQNQKKNEITKENDSNKVKKTKEEKQPQKVSDEKKTKKKKNILLKKKKIVASEKKLYNEHNEIRKNLLKSQNLYAFDTGVSTKDLIKINMHDYDDSRANKKPALLPPQVLDLPINKNRPFTFQLYQEDHKVHSNEIGPDGEWHSPRWWNNYYLNPSYKEPMKFQKNIYAPQLINGYPALSDLCTGAEGFSLDYLFNNKISDGVINNYTDLDNLFVKDANGIYSMDSTTTNYQLNGKTFRHTPQNNESLVPFVPLSYESNQYPNFWFGMDITTNFFLPLNLTNNGKDIQYNFTGDDDLLVYIDDVLVLDLGGIHFPVSGSINFTKNTVTEEYAYTSVFDNGDLQNQRKGTLTHSIDDSFKKAGKTWDPIGAHTIKIFFLERGNGSSTCKMDFNFPLVPPPVNVIYEGNGGMWNGNTSSTDKAVIGENYTVKENFFNRDGYVFTGWNTRADGKGEDWTGKINKPFKWNIDHDVTLYAQWKLNEHTLTYNGNGGTKNGQTIHKDIVTMNQNYTVKENFFNRDGYVFTGWNTKADGKGEDWTGKINKPFKWNINHDVTLYAQWKAAKCTIVYEGNGGTWSGGTNVEDTVNYGSYYTIRNNLFTRNKASFKGWNTRADGKGEDWTSKIGQSIKWIHLEKLVLYAQWDLEPELTAPDKEYYEGEKVTKQDLLKGVVGSDYEDKDITKDVKIRKIEYAYGRLVNGKHQKPYDKVYTPDMPNDELLDTWFMELDKNPGYVIHKVTYEVKDSYGHITITKANVKVKYNNFPVITAEDRYFTLKEAQNGAITKDVLLKDEINKGRLWTDDIEEGKLNHRTDLVEFDPNEFTTLKHDAIIEVTFHAQDTMGPNGNGKETYKSINVHIENIIIPEKEDDDNGRHRRIRFINKKFYDRNDNSDLSAEESPNNGGLNTQSKWYKDPEYRNVIETSFAKTSGTDYVYMPEDIEEIRNFAEVHGVGNTKERGALQQFISQIMNK